MKKSHLLLCGLTVAALLASTGGILAANFMTTQPKTIGVERITTKSIKVGLNNVTKGSKMDDKVVPGTITPFAYQVKNTQQENACDIYVKVILNYGWENDALDNGGEDAKTKLFVEDGTKQIYFPYITDYTKQEKIGKWIVAYADDEQAVLYYEEPLSPNEASSDFMDGIHFTKGIESEYANEQFHLDIEAYAVQANCAPEAIAAEWGVFPKFDAGGCITQILEN